MRIVYFDICSIPLFLLILIICYYRRMTKGNANQLFISMVFMIGLLFEFPTVVMVLSGIGLLKRADLKAARKYAFVIVLLLAALITPSDPVSMFVLGIPLYGLYEFSILVCRK